MAGGLRQQEGAYAYHVCPSLVRRKSKSEMVPHMFWVDLTIKIRIRARKYWFWPPLILTAPFIIKGKLMLTLVNATYFQNF